MAIAVVAAFAVMAPAAANADLTPSVSVTFPDMTPGAHSDINIQQNYSYAGTPGTDVPTGSASKSGDDLKQWILDTPPGFVGNPNAIPYDERCTQAQFANYIKGSLTPTGTNACPTSSVVGSASLVLGLDATGGTATTLAGTIFEVQSAPPNQEVPTQLVTIFTSGPGVAAISKTEIAPVTSGPQGNFQLRSVSEGPIDRPILAAGPTYGFIKQINFTLLGQLANGNFFQTNPTRCDSWDSTLYASSYGSTINGVTPSASPRTNQTQTLSGTATGGGDSSDTYASATTSVTPTAGCTAPAFTASTTSVLNEFNRDSNPSLTVTTTNPGAPGTDIPKTIVATLPASITTDLQSPALQAGVLCEVAQADAATCPAGSKIGSVSIESPMLIAGLSGDVYAVRGATTVPDLRVYVTGALSFQLVGTSKFVGVRGNQIQTTFTNLPQNPFTKFVLTINGSSKGQPDSILTISKCPTDGKSPEDGPISYDMASWGGQASTSAYTPPLADCFGVGKLPKQKKCVKSTLKVKPAIQSTSMLQKTELWIKNGKKYKRVKVYKKYPSNKTLSFRMGSKVKKGKTYSYQVRATYVKTAASPDKNVVKTATSKFKRCK